MCSLQAAMPAMMWHRLHPHPFLLHWWCRVTDCILESFWISVSMSMKFPLVSLGKLPHDPVSHIFSSAFRFFKAGTSRWPVAPSGCFWMGQLGRQIPWIPWQVGAFRSLFDLLWWRKNPWFWDVLVSSIFIHLSKLGTRTENPWKSLFLMSESSNKIQYYEIDIKWWISHFRAPEVWHQGGAAYQLWRGSCNLPQRSLREASLGAGGALLLDPGVGFITHRSHGAGIYGNMDPINIPPMLAYIAYMDPMGYDSFGFLCFAMLILLLYVVVPSNSAQRRDVQTCSDQQTTIYSECWEVEPTSLTRSRLRTAAEMGLANLGLPNPRGLKRTRGSQWCVCVCVNLWTSNNQQQLGGSYTPDLFFPKNSIKYHQISSNITQKSEVFLRLQVPWD